MNYREQQKEKAVKLRDEIFQDPGDGMYKKNKRKFVLSNPALNLWCGIREDAIDYYSSNKITWWNSGSGPTGHLLSSQIACINHLYFLRQRLDLATMVLRNIDNQIQMACRIDTGFVEFEKVGAKNLGNEQSLKRGSNCTSVDAMMIGETIYRKRILFLIEWKYTEFYSGKDLSKGTSGKTRLEAYKELLEDEQTPIIHKPHTDLYYEPFYQLMRQTLLGWEMVKRKEYGVEDWIHLHIIPKNNKELKENKTSPSLKGSNIEEAWKGALREPEKYKVLDPMDFLQPAKKCFDTKAFIQYLEKRYWI